MELCIKNLRDEINADTSSLLDLLMKMPTDSAPNDELENQLATTSTKIVEILYDILRGLEFIHLHKEVHRDLKPENGSPFLTKISNQ
jgi:serine/threonine protein kinase